LKCIDSSLITDFIGGASVKIHIVSREIACGLKL
jgi:hypothetical protein